MANDASDDAPAAPPSIDLDEPPLFEIDRTDEPDLDDGERGSSVNLEGVVIPWEIVQYGNGRLPHALLAPIGIGGHRLHASAAAAFGKLQAAAATAGIDLTCTDTYRTYDQQVDLKQRKPTLAATPGKSVHGWGFAVDVSIGRPPRAFGTSVYTWLKQNAPALGWHLGRPKDEPWHWVYRGPIGATAVAAPTESATAADRPTLRQGASGEAVRWLQQRIGATPDGQFGPATDAAVRAFQHDNALAVDGIVGPRTWAVLHGDTSTVAKPAVENWTTSTPADRPAIRQGDRGDVVRWIQQLVGVADDGVFGPVTDAAVRAFQADRGLTPDGVVGPLTWSALVAT